MSRWLVPLLCCPLLLLAADKSPEEWFDDGLGLVGENKLPEAEAALTAAVKAEPRYKEAWQALAEVLEMEGKTARAKLCRQQAEQAPATRDGQPPELTPAQRIALIDRGGPAAPPGVPVPPAPPAATPPPPPASPPAAKPALQPLPPLTAKGPDGKPKPMVRLSKEGRAQYGDLACGADGTLHAIYTDRPMQAAGAYVYYRASQDNGETWSEAVNLSDDETGRMASFCTLAVDAQNRVYAIWKYLRANEVLDGPGGYKDGMLAMRCLQGGQWSGRLSFAASNEPIFSWYTALDTAGQVHLIYSQTPADSMKAVGFTTYDYCARVAEVILDGAATSPIARLIEPPMLPTQHQIDAAQAAGHPLQLSDLTPKKNGLINLRGLLDAEGRPRFVAEHPGIADGGSDVQTGRRIVLWDGQALRPLYEYEKYKTWPTYDNPPTLLPDPAGKLHLLRQPEKAQLSCVRDYPLIGILPAEPVTVMSCQQGTGKITSFQARNLPGNRIVVTAAMSELDGELAADHELYVLFSEGAGHWTEPFCVTVNADRLKSPLGNPARTTYHARHAAVAIDSTGHPCVLMIAGEMDTSEATRFAAVFIRL